jgi:hypothetical protein
MSFIVDTIGIRPRACGGAAQRLLAARASRLTCVAVLPCIAASMSAGSAQAVTPTLAASAAKVAPSASATSSASGAPVASGTPVAPPPLLPHKSMLPVGIGLAAAAVVLGAGIGTTIASNGKSRDAAAERMTILKEGGQCAKPPNAFVGSCVALKQTFRDLDTLANTARVAYVAAGVLAIGSVTYALLPAPRSVAGRVKALPVVEVGGGGVVVVGAW